MLAIAERGLASVRMSDGTALVDTSLLDSVQVGDLVLVHAGTAIAVVPE